MVSRGEGRCEGIEGKCARMQANAHDTTILPHHIYIYMPQHPSDFLAQPEHSVRIVHWGRRSTLS